MLRIVHRILSVFAGALAVTAQPAAAQSGPHVPGELMIGFESQQAREALVAQLERTRQNLRAGGESVANFVPVRRGSSALKLKVEFAANARLRSNPAAELALLEDLAAQIKANNPGIKYAHPNWIVSVDPVNPGPDDRVQLPPNL